MLRVLREEVIATRADAAELTVHLEGRRVEEGRLAVDDLILLARAVQESIERVALTLLGVASLRPGRRPADVVDATRLEVIRFGPGQSAVLTLGLPQSSRAQQLTAFEIAGTTDIGERAVQLFVSGLSALSAEGPLPEGWDSGVLTAWREVFQLFDRGVEQIEIDAVGNEPRNPWRLRTHIGRSQAEVIGALVRRPLRERRTLDGRLLMADFKERGLRCRIHPPLGGPVECTFSEHLREQVLRALTKHVRVSGEVTLDPESGRIRELAIDAIELDELGSTAVGVAGFWDSPTIEELAAAQGVGPVTDVAALVADFWPPEMSVDEFMALVDDDEPRRPVPA